jgi:sec-independent protein translocase protein TatA
MLGNIGPLEIGIVLIIALIVFGPKRLPELGRNLGRGMREFKETVTGQEQDEDPKAIGTTRAAAAPPEHAEPEVARDDRG